MLSYREREKNFSLYLIGNIVVLEEGRVPLAREWWDLGPHAQKIIKHSFNKWEVKVEVTVQEHTEDGSPKITIFNEVVRSREPGDIIIFKPKPTGHVGIYLGHDLYISSCVRIQHGLSIKIVIDF